MKLKPEENRKEFKPTKDRLRVFRKKMRNKPTPAELKLKKAFKELNLRVQHQRIFFNDRLKCIVDFYFRTDNTNIVVEIDGDYHLNEDQQRKDSYRSKWLAENRGCKVIRFTNNEILNDLDRCLRDIARFYIQNAHRSFSRNYNIFRRLLGLEDVQKKILNYERKTRPPAY